MKELRFFFLLMTIVSSLSFAQIAHYPYQQSFEDEFTTGNNVMFLENWYGNEVSAASRIFRSENARTGSGALGITPLQAYNGIITLHLDMKGRMNSEISFWARSVSNGSGTYHARLRIRASTDAGLTWSGFTHMYDFPNLNSDFIHFTYQLPANTNDNESVRIQFDVRSFSPDGAASGTTASISIDDFMITNSMYYPIVDFDNNSKWIAGSAGLNAYATDHVYIDRNYLFTGGPALRQTSDTQDGFPSTLGNYAWRLNNVGSTDWRATYLSGGGLLGFGFGVRRWAYDVNLNWQVSYSLDGGNSFTEPIWVINNDFLENSSDWKQVEYWFTEPLDVECEQLVVKLGRVSGERILVDDFYFIPKACNSAGKFYRTKASGDILRTCTWEVSANGIDGWHSTDCAPDIYAGNIIVAEGHHVVLTENKVVSDLIIQSNGSIEVVSGKLSLYHNASLIIEEGGKLIFKGGNVPDIQPGATVYVRSGGEVRVSANSSGFSRALAGSESFGKCFYESGAVFHWDVPTLFATANETIFPNASESEIPVFRISHNIGAVGANSNTIINGLLEINGNVTWQNSGKKIFRNGITGTGSITQSSSTNMCGEFQITGAPAVLRGITNLNLNANGLIISGDVTVSGNKVIQGGPITITGKLDPGNSELTLTHDLILEPDATFVAGTSTLIMAGTTTQQIVLSQPLSLYNFTIANEDGIMANDDIEVSNALSLQGNIDMGANVLRLGSASDNTGMLLYEKGKVAGKLIRWIGETSIGTDISFPVGKDDRFLPVTINLSQILHTGSILVEFMTKTGNDFYGNLPIYDGDLIIDNLSSAGYWLILADNGFRTQDFQITLSLDTYFHNGMNNPDRVRIVKRDTGTTEWEIAGNFISGSYQQIIHGGVNGFSEFALGGSFIENPLPVELLYFKAIAHTDHILVQWATATEINNDFFLLERSIDLFGVVPLIRIDGAGFSNELIRYSYRDEAPLPGTNYYRLVQTDFDGTVCYGEWIGVEWKATTHQPLQIENLFRQNDGSLKLVFYSENSWVDIMAMDAYGRLVYYKRYASTPGRQECFLNVDAQGLLLVTLYDGRQRDTARIILNP